MIKISVPNDDSAALFHLGKSLIDLSSAVEGSPYWVVITQYEYDDLKAREPVEVGPVEGKAYDDLIRNLSEITRVPEYMLRGKSKHVEPDTTSQQVESLSFEKLQNLNPKTPAPAEFPQQWKEAATKVISEAVEQGAFTDSTGTPWDERIHSASKALNADDTWRLRRKPKDMDEMEWGAFVQNVQDELKWDSRQLGASEEHVVIATSPSDELDEALEEYDELVNVTPEGDDFHTDAGVVTEQQVASFPPPPPVPVSAVQAALEKGMERYGDAMSKLAENDGAPSLTFPQVMAFLTERHGRITSAQVDQIIADMGLEKITDLNTKPEHTGPFIARVKALLGE